MNLIEEIQKLPIEKKFFIIEETLQLIKKEEIRNKMEVAADLLLEDYNTDKELTVFTFLDFENFYESK